MSTAGTQTIYRILVESTNLTGHGFYCHGMIIVSSHTSYRRDQWYWVVLGSYGSDPSLNPRLNPNCLVELGFKSYMWHAIRGLSLRTSVVTFISARLWYWVILGTCGSDPSLNPSLNPNYPVELGFMSSGWHVIRGLTLKTSVATFIRARLWYWVLLGGFGVMWFCSELKT